MPNAGGSEDIVIGHHARPFAYSINLRKSHRRANVARRRGAARADAGAALLREDGRCALSLRDANLLLLVRHGVRAEHIDVSAVCTRCQDAHWFSHRGQGAATGRFGAMIAVPANGPGRRGASR